jgi:hypothetical protein
MTDLPENQFPEAKITVNFHSSEARCIATFWTPNASEDTAIISDIHCFLLDFDKATSTKVGELCLSVQDQQASISKATASSASAEGDVIQAWIAHMDSINISTVLSTSGEYLVLSASLGSQKWQRILDLPSEQESQPETSPSTALASWANPRSVGASATYWHQYRYSVSVQRQRVLLHRATRNTSDRDAFYSLSCHEQVAIVPGYLANAEAWLLIPETNDGMMSVLLVATDHPPEVMRLAISWDMVNERLNDTETKYEGVMSELG